MSNLLVHSPVVGYLFKMIHKEQNVDSNEPSKANLEYKSRQSDISNLMLLSPVAFHTSKYRGLPGGEIVDHCRQKAKKTKKNKTLKDKSVKD